jgi:hypothetical protein
MLLGGPDVPSAALHMRLAKPSADHGADRRTLQRVADHMLSSSNVLVCVTRYSALEAKAPPPPALVLYAHLGLGEREVAAAVAAVKKAAKEVL